eukprot:4488033-Pyramimonas_sp.AAC.1
MYSEQRNSGHDSDPRAHSRRTTERIQLLEVRSKEDSGPLRQLPEAVVQADGHVVLDLRRLVDDE